MVIADVFYLDYDGHSCTDGFLYSNGGPVTASDPSRIALQTILAEPIQDHRTGSVISPHADPVAFLHALPLAYHGHAFHVKLRKVQDEVAGQIPAHGNMDLCAKVRQ